MTASAKKHVLIMDDSTIVLDTLRVVLEGAGYAVTTAADLTQLEAARAGGAPDLFILDVQMPEAFGDDVARVLREVRRVAVPILLFSSMDEAALRARAEDAELAGFVSKSGGLGPLVARVKELLG
jgi:DNA-binding response OmpR family regulator